MSTFGDTLRGRKEFIVTCEYVPGRASAGAAVEEVVECGKKLKATGLGVHALSITDNPGGNPAITPDVLAAELQTVGVESLVHFSCASMNRNMMESRAHSLMRRGLSNVLVISGDYPMGGYQGRAKPVCDLDSVQTIRYLKDMNKGLELPGKKKDGTQNRLAPTNFTVACGASPFKFTEAETVTQYAKMEKKIAAGADFVITQLGYDVRKFAELMKYLQYRNIDIPVFGNCYVLSKMVGRLMNKGELPGCVVTDEFMAVLEQESQAADKGKQARLDRAAKLVAIFRGLTFAGVHIGGFGLKYDDIEFVVKKSEEWTPRWKEFIPDFQFGRKGEFYLFPEDPDLSFAPDKLKPVTLAKRSVPSLNFALSKLSHRLVFTKGAIGYKIGKAFYSAIAKNKPVGKLAYLGERIAKEVLFDCQECGDCALFDIAYLCPMSNCAKFQRNGPCGGSRDGMCEADAEKKCLWVKAYDRFSAMGKLDDLRKGYVPPVNCALSGTSGWANYFLGRDHTTQKTEPEPASGHP